MDFEKALREFGKYDVFKKKYENYTSKPGPYENQNGTKNKKTSAQLEMQRFLYWWLFSAAPTAEEHKKKNGRIVVAQDAGLQFVYSWAPSTKESKNSTHATDGSGREPGISSNPENDTLAKKNSSHTFALVWKNDTELTCKRKANGHVDMLSRWVTRANGSKLRQLCIMTIFAIALQIKAECPEIDLVQWHGVDICYKTLEQMNRTLAQIEKVMVGDKTRSTKCFAQYEAATITRKKLIVQLNSQENENSYHYMEREWPIDFASSDITREEFEKESLEVRFGVYEQIADEIIKVASKLPVLSEAIKTVTGNEGDKRNSSIRSLLQALCTIALKRSTSGESTSGESTKDKLIPLITIKPIVAGAMENFDRLYSNEKLRDQFYTRQDALHILGRVAYELSRCADSGYKMPKELLYEKFLFPETDIPMFEQILQEAQRAERERKAGGSAAQRNKVLSFIEKDGNCYRFKYKQLRLVFLGIHYAMIAQDGRKFDQVLMEMINVRRELPKNHTRWNFDELAIVGASMLIASSYFDRRTMLEMLQKMAKDHSADNREQQEIALHILSYYLCEGPQVTHKMRMEIFKTCFAQDSYELQANMWKYLGQIPAYKSAVQDAFDAVFEAKADKATAEAQYFFLWWSLMGKKNFYKPGTPQAALLYACQCQHASWLGGNLTKIWRYEDVIAAIGKAVQRIKVNDPYLVGYVFALNALLYSMANMTLVKTDVHAVYAAEIEAKAVNGSDREVMRKAVVICDYWTRRTCGSYQDSLESKSSDTAAVYMLSGATRFLAAYRPVWEPLTESSDMPIYPDIESFYGQCFRAEKTLRFKYLLLRVVGLTDRLQCLVGPDDDMREEYQQATFLAYDNMPKTWDEFREELSRNRMQEGD